MAIFLNKNEILILKRLSVENINDEELKLLIYNLQLLVDEDTGLLELSNEAFDQIRYFAFRENLVEGKLLYDVFRRTLGDNLDLGFFDQI